MNSLLHPLPSRPPEAFAQRIQEVSLFFDGSDRVHQTMRRVAARLRESGIPYAIVGGMAVNAYRHERTTGIWISFSPRGAFRSCGHSWRPVSSIRSPAAPDDSLIG